MLPPFIYTLKEPLVSVLTNAERDTLPHQESALNVMHLAQNVKRLVLSARNAQTQPSLLAVMEAAKQMLARSLALLDPIKIPSVFA